MSHLKARIYSTAVRRGASLLVRLFKRQNNREIPAQKVWKQGVPKSSSPLRILNVLFESRYGGPQKRVSQVGEALSVHGVRTILCQPLRYRDELQMAQEVKLP